MNFELKPKVSTQTVECTCHYYLEIVNFTTQDIESKYAIGFKRVTVNGISYLAVLYDQLYESFRDQQVLNDQLLYNIKLHELTMIDEGNGSFSTKLFEQVYTVTLEELNLQENFQYESAFYKLSFLKSTSELVIFNEGGLFIATIDLSGKQ